CCPVAVSQSIQQPSPPIWSRRTSRSSVRRPNPDKPGGNEKGKDYEDYVKAFINPGNPTPRGWAFQLPNPTDNGALVHFDDCQRSTGMVAEIKGKYAGVLAFQQGEDRITEEWLDQSGRQVAARGWRRHRWYFAEPETAAFAADLFKTADEGREMI